MCTHTHTHTHTHETCIALFHNFAVPHGCHLQEPIWWTESHEGGIVLEALLLLGDWRQQLDFLLAASYGESIMRMRKVCTVWPGCCPFQDLGLVLGEAFQGHQAQLPVCHGSGSTCEQLPGFLHINTPFCIRSSITMFVSILLIIVIVLMRPTVACQP